MSGFKISRLATGVTPSATLSIEERYRTLKAQGKDVISLGVGEPDFDTAPAAKAGGIAAIERGETRYTSVAGVPSLRAAIARKLKEQNGLFVTPEQVVVSAGAKQALFHALVAFLDPGDDVYLPTPAWPSYHEMVRLAGGRRVTIPLSPANGWKLTAEALVAALRMRPHTPGLLLLSNPNNPTGAVYTREELSRLAEVICGENLSVIVDEIYEQLVFEGEFVSFATLPGMRQRTVTVNGVSKAFAMTGWRIGYAAGPAPFVAAMTAVQSHTSGNAASISQHAAEAALVACLEGGEGRASLDRMKYAFTRRRDLVARQLDAIPGVHFVKPSGAFFFFVDVSAHYGRAVGDTCLDGSRALAAHLLEEAGVAVVPGVDFGDDRCIRLSIAASAEDLTVAIRRIAKTLGAATPSA